MIGQTQDVGFQIGVSKTIPFPVNQVWDLLTSPEGVALWLGEGARLTPEKGLRYETTDGTAGEIRGYHEQNRIRLTWRPRTWDHDTTMQVTVSTSGGKTVLRFHQEWLTNSSERELQHTHWQNVLKTVVEALENP